MTESEWKKAFHILAPLHEGVPIWFFRFVDYMASAVQGRDRFSIYNACRIINSDQSQDKYLYTQEIRDVLERFKEEWIEFVGGHEHKIFVDKIIMSFWVCFFHNSKATEGYDLDPLFPIMREWRVRDLILSDSHVKHLPSNCKSYSKEILIRRFLRSLLSSRNCMQLSGREH